MVDDLAAHRRKEFAPDKLDEAELTAPPERQSLLLPSTDEIFVGAYPKLMGKMKMVVPPFHVEKARAGEARLLFAGRDVDDDYPSKSSCCWTTEDRYCLQAYSPKEQAYDFYFPALMNLSVGARDSLVAQLDHIPEDSKRGAKLHAPKTPGEGFEYSPCVAILLDLNQTLETLYCYGVALLELVDYLLSSPWLFF